MLPWHLVKPRGNPPYSAPADKVPQPTTLLIKGTRQAQFLVIPEYRFQCPASPWSHSHKLITSSCKIRWHPTLLVLILPACLPQPPFVHSVPKCNLHVTLYGMWSSSGPWVYETVKMLICLLMAVVYSTIPTPGMAKSTPYQWAEDEVIKAVPYKYNGN